MTPRSHETTHPFQSPSSASHALGSCQPHSPETICAIPSSSQHIPTPPKSSQAHTLQILLPHQYFPSNPNTPVCSHTLRLSYILQHPLELLFKEQSKIQTTPRNSQAHLHNKLTNTSWVQWQVLSVYSNPNCPTMTLC